MTTNRPGFVSEEELVKQLQAVLRAVKDVPDEPPSTERVHEARALAEELSMRIYNDPERWGIGNIPDGFRDDVVADTYTELLFSVDSLRSGRQPIVEWFGKTAESKFQKAWSLSESRKAERERQEVARAANPGQSDSGGPDTAPAAFSLPNDGWVRFEAEFPRDAFALRLRYLLNQTPEQMAAMLDAPSPRAITMRLDRARDRFRMFCEQQGVSRRELSSMLSELSEESR